jgi:hypothetical protein
MTFALVAPASAVAQSPTEGYNQVAGVEGGGGDGAPASAPGTVGGSESAPASAVGGDAQAGSESLPVTGLELGVIAAAGLLLLGAGLVMRRAGTTR